MDQVFLDLIGKPKLNAPKLISIIVDNFSLLEDQCRFLRATLAIPQVKKLPITDGNKRLVHIGNLPSFVYKQIEAENWTIHKYDTPQTENISDAIANDLTGLQNRSIIFITDLSRVELLSNNPRYDLSKLLLLVDSLKRNGGHFVVLLYQNTSNSQISEGFIRNMEYLSDAMIRVKTCKAGYFKHIWYQPVLQSHTTLLPPKVETAYYTCKIGEDFWSSDLLCFYDKKKIPKNYNLDEDTYIQAGDSENESDAEEADKRDSPAEKCQDPGKTPPSIESNLNLLKPDELDDEYSFSTKVRPYMIAQNPERSQIFYYPDKDDDFDEDDPDSDLNI